MELDVSQVDNYQNLGGISEPVIGQNKATADVTLKDGEVNLIGGIIQDTNSKAITGIPGLANLPILGRLFNSENIQKNKTELVIAMIPHVVRIPYFTSSNLKGVAAGNSTQIKVNYAPQAPGAPVAPQSTGLVTTPASTGPPATAPPMSAMPMPPPVTAPPAPAGPPPRAVRPESVSCLRTASIRSSASR